MESGPIGLYLSLLFFPIGATLLTHNESIDLALTAEQQVRRGAEGREPRHQITSGSGSATSSYAQATIDDYKKEARVPPQNKKDPYWHSTQNTEDGP